MYITGLLEYLNGIKPTLIHDNTMTCQSVCFEKGLLLCDKATVMVSHICLDLTTVKRLEIMYAVIWRYTNEIELELNLYILFTADVLVKQIW